MKITFTIYGVPTAKGRPRHRAVNTKAGKSFTMAYTPKKTQLAEESFLAQAVSHKPAQPITVPIQMVVTFVMPIPKSTSKKMKEVMAYTRVPHTKRPDKDNLEKLILDSLNEVFWKDDSQVWRTVAEKIYGDPPRTEVEIEWEEDTD